MAGANRARSDSRDRERSARSAWRERTGREAIAATESGARGRHGGSESRGREGAAQIGLKTSLGAGPDLFCAGKCA